MDYIAFVFYAIICGLLSILAPQFGTTFIRFGIGAAIGGLCAIVLPLIKGALGGY